MTLLKKIKPDFWDHHRSPGGEETSSFNFQRKWKLLVLMTSIITLTPLFILALVEYQITKKARETEVAAQTAKAVSNARWSIDLFLNERKSALQFILQDNTVEALSDDTRLASILKNLKAGVGGFIDIGVVDASGRMRAYSGPSALKGRSVAQKRCFREALANGAYVGSLESIAVPSRELIMVLKHRLSGGSFFLLRCTLAARSLERILSRFDPSARHDLFLMNDQGHLLTPSHIYGDPPAAAGPEVPEYSDQTRVIEHATGPGTPMIMGYTYIPGTAFILMLIKPTSGLMQPWFKPRMQLVGFLVLSIAAILLAVLGMATYLVNRIYAADRKRVMALHQVEYTNKLASLGRLSAGVAHEINNPLAIINEKAGLIKDLFTFKEAYRHDEKLLGLIDTVIEAVERCSSVTQRLLSFSRHMDSEFEMIRLVEIVQEVLRFLEKEAQRKGIEIVVRAPDKIPEFESNYGNLQQIFLNIFNNAFSAMEKGGRLGVDIRRRGDDAVDVVISDNGVGIPQKYIHRIFDPFFSTQNDPGRTGLGLSITFGLTREIGGDISVESEVGKGTAFTVTLPLKKKRKPKRPPTAYAHRQWGAD